MTKIKVVWLCHYFEDSLNGILPLRRKNKQFSPWIPEMLQLFEKQEEVEIHVISPVSNLKTQCYSFKKGNIYFHFFNKGIPFWGQPWPGIFGNIFKLDYRTGFALNNYYINKYVEKIKPDIIHLHGAEDPTHSVAILKLSRKYEVVFTVQGFGQHSKSTGYQVTKRRDYEKKILSSLKHFVTYNKFMEDVISQYNINPMFYHCDYYHPIRKPKQQTKGPYDLVYFARLCKEKGIEDLMIALNKVVKVYPDITLCVIGFSTNQYMSFLYDNAINLNIAKNIHWLGFLKYQEEAFDVVSKSKMMVLPTYHDISPGTLIETAYLKVPTIAYSVGDLPEYNEEMLNIYLVPPHDTNALANAIIELYKNDNLRMTLSNNAYCYFMQRYSNRQKIFEQHLNCYKTILANG